MAAMYPPNNMVPNQMQGSGEPHPNHQGQKYMQRVYQPYVFQPNFLKQQIRQREQEKAARLGQGEDSTRFGQLGQSSALSTSISEDARKKSGRKVIDWTPSCCLYLERRRWQRSLCDVPSLLPDPSYSIEMQAPMAYRENSASSVATKFVRSATNKMKCPVYKVVWTPDGRRLVTGSASGEFTLWNGTAFNFETILQAHDSPVRAMSWSHNDSWLITGDNQGYIKYWQLNMNNVKMYQAHKDQACRSVSFCPNDSKFVTGSDDGTVRVWDFLRCHEENILRGHGSDVKQVDWHPQKGLVLSASKDLQTPVKLWDPKAGQGLATIHAHKGTVMDVKFNRNGTWFLTASRDHLIKLYDIRNLKEEVQVFRGHKKEAFSVAWHPIHEDMFASGGSEGSIIFWQVGEEKELGGLEGAHDSLIWSLAWHPLGHILVSGSNDHSTKFWTRNRPGDNMKDKYNLTSNSEELSAGKAPSSMANHDDSSTMHHIPGMGDTDAAAADVAKREEDELNVGIPGLDWSYEEKSEFKRKMVMQHDRKKIPFARPVPRNFAAAWESKQEGAAPRREWSRSPSPPRRERFEEPPPWRREERLPRFHRGPPPGDWHPGMGEPPPRGQMMDDPRQPPQDFHQGRLPPGNEPYREIDPRIHASERRHHPSMDAVGFQNRNMNNEEEDRHFREKREEFLSPTHRDREFDNLGPEEHNMPPMHRPPLLQDPGLLMKQPSMNYHDQVGDGPTDQSWTGGYQEPPYDGDMNQPPMDDRYRSDMYDQNRNSNPSAIFNEPENIRFNEGHNHHEGFPERGMMRGRPRGGFRGRPPPIGRGRRGFPRFPSDGMPSRGRSWPLTRSNAPIRMRRGGRRPG